MDRLLAYAFSIGLLGLAWLLRRGAGTWGTPAGLLCTYWFLFSFIPLLAVPSAPVNPLSVAFIFLACLAFSMPAFLVRWRDCFRVNTGHVTVRDHYLDGRFVWTVFLVSCPLSILFVLADFLVQGMGMRELIFNFFQSANEYLAKRYEGEVQRNFFGQSGLILAYMASTTGGLLYASHHTTRRGRVLVAAMLPSIAILLVQAAKGMFFMSIALVLGGVWLYRTLMDVRPHVDVRGLFSYFRYLPAVLALVIVSFLTRGLYEMEDTSEVLGVLLSYLRAYAFMHLYAFSDWFSFHLGQPSLLLYTAEPPALGFFSFIAIFRLLGSTKEVPPGVYDEYFFIEGTNPGNLYTIFRGLIIDFGLVGSLVSMLVCGYLVNSIYRHMLVTPRPAVSVGVMFIYVNMLYTAYIISAFMWLTTIVVGVLTIMLFVLARWSRR